MAVEFEDTKYIISKLGVGKGGEVHKFFTSECARYMDKYVPYREGTLSQTVIKNGKPTSNVGVDTITYAQEYASYVYYGLSKSGKPLDYTKRFHRLAGPYWDEKMVTADMPKIEKNTQEFFDRRNNG